MKLKNLVIKNLRGLQQIELNSHGITTIIGKNNCGKSSVLRAIELVCTGVKPDYEEFFLRGDHNIEIEATFDGLKEWERNSPAISGLIYDNQLKLKYIASSNLEEGKRKIDVCYYAFKQQETIQGWSENWPEVSDQLKQIADAQQIKTAANFKTKANKEKLKQAIRDSYPDLIQQGHPEWTDDSIQFNNALQQAIPKVILIPAVKDATDESKYSKTGKNAFTELMKKLILPQIQAENAYGDIMTAITALSDKIHGEDGIEGIKQINTRLSDRLSRLINAKANIKFDNPEIDTVISSGVGLRILDGDHDTPIGLQGHGLQRTLIFSLLEMVAENEAAIGDENVRTTILLYEEPELYLHPQMLRKLKSIIRVISSSDNWQTVCSTHSPVFIDVADQPESLVILSRAGNGSIAIKQLSDNPFENSESGMIERDALRAALDFHPTVCEVFFADKVVLVEGDTEMAIFKHCEELLTYSGVDILRALDCTIISCGGKWTIPAIARLLDKFGIAFKIIHDLDRHNKTDEEIANLPTIHPYRVNARIALITAPENIFVCEDTLEDLWGGAKSDKPFNAIKTNRQLIAEGNLPAKVRDLVRFAYNDFLQDN